MAGTIADRGKQVSASTGIWTTAHAEMTHKRRMVIRFMVLVENMRRYCNRKEILTRFIPKL